VYRQFTLDALGASYRSTYRVASPFGERCLGCYFVLKRLLDIVVALLALIILLPVMAVIALLIVIDSPGPVIFAQKRVGAMRRCRLWDGAWSWQLTTFICYKFRSMVKNANPAVHHAFVRALVCNNREDMADIQGMETEAGKLVSDPRITRIGRVIRRYSVLKGDMSLVGPRPCIPYEMDEYRLWHHSRLEAQPGLTGLWQITARGSSDFDEMVRLDIRYVEHQSFWLDLKILLMTPLAVLSGKGAA
jgi:lipopolysaccharide/colanic/teichoic acid biosynthesis glycosyltransferase